MASTSLQPVGAWLGASFGRLRQRWATLSALFAFGALATVAGVVLVYALALVFVGSIHGWDNLGRVVSDPRRLGFFLEQSGLAFALFNSLAAFVALRVQCWIFHAAIHASADPSLGFGMALSRGKRRGYGFLALVIVQQVLVGIGTMLLIVPGILLAVLFGFAPWAFARNDASALKALGESARMVKHHFLGVLGRMLLAGLVALPIAIVPVIGWVIAPAFALCAWSLLHDDIRQAAPAVVPRPVRPVRVSRATA